MHHFFALDWLAVMVAALAGFMLGALWYSPVLFAKPWMEEFGYTEEFLQQNANPGKAMGVAGVIAITHAALLEIAFSQLGVVDVVMAAKVSLLIGVGFVALSYFSDAQFNLKSNRLVFIEAGYRACYLTVIGIVLALF